MPLREGFEGRRRGDDGVLEGDGALLLEAVRLRGDEAIEHRLIFGALEKGGVELGEGELQRREHNTIYARHT